MLQRVSKRLVWLSAAAVVLVVAGWATWLLWPEPPRQREYLDATACLLTDDEGVTGAAAEPTWAALQESSVDTHVRVQYLAVAGEQTPANVRAHLNSLTGSKCGLVVATGPAQIDAVTAAAPTATQVRFLTVGGGTEAANVTTASTDSVRSAVERELKTLAGDA